MPSNVKKLGIFDPKYKWYAFYSWGCPLLVSIVTFVMQNLPEDFEEYIVLPKIGEKNCFFSSDSSKLFYFHIINGPILVNILYNYLMILPIMVKERQFVCFDGVHYLKKPQWANGSAMSGYCE